MDVGVVCDASNSVRVLILSVLICILFTGDSDGRTGSWNEWWTIVDVDAMLSARSEAVSEYGLIRSCESSSGSLIDCVERRLESLLLRMQRAIVDMRPILVVWLLGGLFFFLFLGCCWDDLFVCIGYVWCGGVYAGKMKSYTMMIEV